MIKGPEAKKKVVRFFGEDFPLNTAVHFNAS
jgi:hypothetical protein